MSDPTQCFTVCTTQELCALWLEHKQAEAAVTAARHEIEAELAKRVPTKEEGQLTTEQGDFKVTTKTGFTRKLDLKKWAEVAKSIPPDRWPVKTVTELDNTGVKWLMENDPENWAKASKAITVKPSKIGFTVERIENNG